VCISCRHPRVIRDVYTFILTRTFSFTAMDTTSSALSRTLGLLASHPDVQEKVRQEVLDALEKNEGQDFSYDQLVSLPMLDAVCRETLRLYVRRLLVPLFSDCYCPSGIHLSQWYTERTSTLWTSFATVIDLQLLGPGRMSPCRSLPRSLASMGV
jgi:hypothetical protein